jgi:hypothetical protein
MKTEYVIEKFNFNISISERVQGPNPLPSSMIKQKLYRRFYPEGTENPFFLYQIISRRIQDIAFKEGYSAYVTNYEEREGSLVILFTLLIDSLVLFGSLRSVADYIEKDLEVLLSTDDLFIRGKITELPNQSSILRVHNSNDLKKRLKIYQTVTIFFLAALLTALYMLAKPNTDNKESQKIEITVNGIDSILNKQDRTERPSINKDTSKTNPASNIR